ncbi:MAG: TRAP transporter small permease [Candidatus Methylomirabilales bacterium]
MRFLHWIDDRLGKLEEVLIAAILAGMVLLAFLQVFLRNFWGLGLPWLDVLLRHLVLWLGIAGASLATKRRRHIRIDVLPRLFPSHKQWIIERGIASLSAVVSTVLGLAAIDLVRQERLTGSVAFGPVPTWLLQLILPIGFGILAFRFVLQALLGRPASPGGGVGGEDRWVG